jgi:thioredoxin 1
MITAATLDTSLKHLETEKEIKDLVEHNENVMISCGRMGPMCVPVYGAMEELETEYPHVQFRDIAFDSSESAYIRNLPQCRNFSGLPFTVYFKNGKVVAATSSIQTKNQIKNVLDREFSAA